MFKNIFKSIGWFVFYIMASVIGTIIASVVCLLASGPGILDNMEDPTAFEQSVTDSVMSAAIPGLLIAAILCIIVFVIYKSIRKHPLDISKVEWKKLLFFSGVGGILNAVFSFGLGALSTFFPETLITDLEEATSLALDGQPFWLLLLCTGILVPIMEEIIFRYGIHGTIARSNVVVAYIVSSLIFGIMHGNVIQGAYTSILGFILAYVYTKTNNLWYPIVIHMTINSTSVIATSFSSEVFALLITFGISLIVSVILFATNKDIRYIFRKENITEKERTAV